MKLCKMIFIYELEKINYKEVINYIINELRIELVFKDSVHLCLYVCKLVRRVRFLMDKYLKE